MTGQKRRMVSIDELRIGAEATTSYCDANGVLLIARGVVITATLVEKLRRHGVQTLHVGNGERLSSDAPAPSRGTRTPGSGVAGPKPIRGQPLQGSPYRPGSPRRGSSGDRDQKPSGDRSEPIFRPDDTGLTSSQWELQPTLQGYSPQKLARLGRLHTKSHEAVERLAERLIETGSLDLQDADPVIEGYIKELADDPDPVIAATLLYESNLSLARRCVQFSTLAMAAGLRIGLSSTDLRDVGRAALVHDWGLFDLPPDRRFPQQLTTTEARQEYQQHPLVAEAMMQTVRGSTLSLAVLVAQVHELMNGGGFPRRLQGEAIHPLARILCVADAYLTLTSPPPEHPRIVPCDAVAFLLSGVSRGHYSPSAVSGLVEALTLYPIGSLVELSDTTQAHVVRANGRDYGYPVVERVAEPGRRIDLKEASLFVTRPVLRAAWREVRLPDSYTGPASTRG